MPSQRDFATIEVLNLDGIHTRDNYIVAACDLAMSLGCRVDKFRGFKYQCQHPSNSTEYFDFEDIIWVVAIDALSGMMLGFVTCTIEDDSLSGGIQCLCMRPGHGSTDLPLRLAEHVEASLRALGAEVCGFYDTVELDVYRTLLRAGYYPFRSTDAWSKRALAANSDIINKVAGHLSSAQLLAEVDTRLAAMVSYVLTVDAEGPRSMADVRNKFAVLFPASGPTLFRALVDD